MQQVVMSSLQHRCRGRWVMSLASVALSMLMSGMHNMVQAQAFPQRSVRMIVPFAPGGPGDVIGRTLSDRLAPLWGQPVVVDNKPGAGGNLGSDLTAKAPADGYTILLAANSHVTNGALYDKLPYDPIRDFTPISMVAYYALVLVTNLDLPVRNLRDLVDYARAHPGKLSFGSAGTGTPTHLAAELFRGVAGIDLVHVPYKGAAPATADLLGGSLQGMFNNPVSALPQVKAGKVRAIATTGLQRSLTSPEVPTVAESGYPGFEAGTWFAMLGPAGIPREIVGRLSADLGRVLNLPEVRQRMAAQGVEAVPGTPDQLGATMRADLEKWTRVIRAGNIRPD